MYGVQLAFKDFSPKLGIWGSQWSEPLFKYFRMFLNSYKFSTILRNTLTISFYSLLANFPLPIILALLLNEVKSQKYKKLIQNITYAPYFISIVVLIGMINLFFNYTGVINQAIALFGLEKINFLAQERLFSHLYVWSGVWQNTGYASVIYFAALSTVPQEHHEAAIIDGASRIKRIVYINLPYIMPTIVILLILSAGRIMSVGFEKVFLMQNTVILGASEIIATYVYKLGIQDRNYSLSGAVGLFNNVINLILLIIVNSIARKLGETSLW